MLEETPVVQQMIWYLQGLKATQLRGDPHTLIVLTTTPLSELITMR